MTSTLMDSPMTSISSPAGLERRFIISCLRTAWAPAAAEQVRDMMAGNVLDWARVVALTQTEGVTPLLHQALRDQALVPPASAAALAAAYHTSRLQNMLMLAQLEAVLRRLTAADLPVIVLKGAALIETIYQRAALRPMVDLDLLLHTADVHAAIDLLRPLGYAPEKTDLRAGATLDFENEIMLRRSEPPGGMLEIHWSLFDSPHHQTRMDPTWFWQTASMRQVGQAATLVLGPEAQLLHLCGHLWLHHRRQPKLLWQHDIAALLAHDAAVIDWELVMARAQQYDLVLPLQNILALLAQEWEPPLSPQILARIIALQPSGAERHALASIDTAQESVAGRFWTDLAGQRSWRAQLSYAWANLFPSTAYMRHRYAISAPWLTPVYYPYRWLRGAHSLLLPRKPKPQPASDLHESTHR